MIITLSFVQTCNCYRANTSTRGGATVAVICCTASSLFDNQLNLRIEDWYAHFLRFGDYHHKTPVCPKGGLLPKLQPPQITREESREPGAQQTRF